MTIHRDLLLEKAHHAMKNAYAPYSQFQVGACILTETGEYFSGCNVENASYPLTVCAEMSAIAGMVSAGKTRIAEILIISSGDLVAPPCGACRQRICEFATENTQVHLYNTAGEHQTYTLNELLPHAFGAKNLPIS